MGVRRVPPGLLRLAGSGLHRAGLLGPLTRAVSWARNQPVFQILTYHRVNDDHDPFFPAVPTPVFAAQIHHISATYTVLTVEELVDRMQRGRVPRNALAITFDDGHRDTLTHAAPILARYALRATIFLATAYIGSSQRPWFDEVAMAFKTTRARSATTPWGTTVKLGTRAERLTALDEAWNRLKTVPEAEFKDTLDRLLGALDPMEPPCEGSRSNGMLSWHEVKTLTRLGFTVGAHTLTHPILSRLTIDRARREIEESRDMIYAVLGSPPHAFAYPNGAAADYSAEIVRLVRDAGFTCAVTMRFGANTLATSPWELRRGGPWEDYLPTFALKLAAYRLMTT